MSGLLSTPRLKLRELVPDDDAFIVELLNTPGFLRYIGDRGVRDRDDARRYLADGPIASYRRNGHGLMAVQRRGDDALIGMCGILRRDPLDEPDIGFAFLPAHVGRGYAFEAASATMRHARAVVGLKRIAAITDPDNDASIGLLGKLGFKFVRMIRIGDAATDSRLFLHDPDDVHD